MTGEQYTVAQFAACLYDKIQLYGEAEAVGIGCTLRNQVRAANGERGWLDIISHDLRLWLCESTPKRADDPTLLKALRIAEAIYTNRQADTTNGALYWQDSLRQNAVPKTVIGSFFFY